MKTVFDKMPANLEEFKAMELMDLTKPENTCTMFLCALQLFVEDREVGVEAINILKGPVALSNYDINFLRDRFMDKPYMPLIYFEGAKPENNYTPDMPYTLEFAEDPRPQDVEEGYVRLYLRTAGADNPRHIKLRQKDGNWYIWDYPGLLMDVRKPAKEDPWT